MRLRDARRPAHVYELLTLAAACERFRLFPQRLYQLVAEGAVHPVQPHGRILYPEWELSDALKGRHPWWLKYGLDISAIA